MAEGICRGADYLEIDIQLTKDGIPIVFHDVRLEERTSLSGYVHEFCYRQLKGAIPGLCTLTEAMEWGRGQQINFALEIKTVPLEMQKYSFQLVGKMAAIIREMDMQEYVYVFGIDYQVLQYLHTCAPEIMIGLIVPHVPADPVKLMTEMHAAVYLSYIYQMTPEIIKDLHAHGFFVSGAILRDEKWVYYARTLGVDMFESDNPEKYFIAH